MFRAFEIETTTVCNLKCANCPVATHPRKPAHMPETLFHKAVDELAELGFSGDFSPHFYNEPFADKRIVDLMGYAADRLPQARFVIFTNATLLTPDLFRAMQVACPVREYVVSIDELVIEKAVTALKKELSADEGAMIRTRMLVDGFLSNRGGLVEPDTGLVHPGRCMMARDYMVVNAYGDVVLCYNDYLGNSTFGNIAEQSLMDIWNQPDFRVIREDAAKGVFHTDLCEACRLSESVQGG